jgi:hypothetical protein
MPKEYSTDTRSAFTGDLESMPKTLPNHKLQEVAAAAHCNPNTVRTYLQGGMRRASTIENIETALREKCLTAFVTPQGTYPNAPIVSAEVSSVSGVKA